MDFDELTCAKFKLGSDGLAVILSERDICHSPLGLSLLFWILRPSFEHAPFLLNIIDTSSRQLNNCLIRTISGFTSNNQSPCELVIPVGWTFWFDDLPDNFLQQHGEIGNLGVKVGSPTAISELETNTYQTRRIKRFGGKIRNMFWKQDNLKGIMDILQCEDKTGEVLFLTATAKLMYNPCINRKYETTSVSTGLNFLGLGNATLNHGPSEMYKDSMHLLFEGLIVPFDSLNQFASKEFFSKREGDLIGRMKWLHRVLNYKCYFPAGQNNGFLRAIITEWDTYKLHDIFEEKDLRICKSVLQKHNVTQKSDHSNKLLLAKISGIDKQYIAECTIVDDSGEVDGNETSNHLTVKKVSTKCYNVHLLRDLTETTDDGSSRDQNDQRFSEFSKIEVDLG